MKLKLYFFFINIILLLLINPSFAQMKSFEYDLFVKLGILQSQGNYAFNGKPVPNIQAGVNIMSPELFSNFKIVSGLGFSYFQGDNVTEFSLDLNQSYEVATRSKEKYLFLVIPLLIQYQLDKINIFAGPNLNYLLLEDYDFIYEISPPSNDLQIFYPNETRSFYFSSEVGIMYDFGKVKASLSFGYFYSSLYKSELVNSNLYGIQFGLLYTL